MVSYQVARPSEYLAITGWKIDDIKLVKKAFILPGQKCTRVDVSPVNYTFQVQAMSAEKLPFVLPAVLTIGPRVNDLESLVKYAKLLSPHDKNSNHINELVEVVIEGETRVLAASMTMEEIFMGTKEFKKEVFEKVQLELNQFGLLIYNANVKQLVDVQGHEYFSYLGQKTQMEAANQAKLDVAEAKMKGAIGAKEREGRTAQYAAEIDAETKVVSIQRQGESQKEEIKVKTSVKIFENEKEAEVSKANAELASAKACWSQFAEVAKVEAEKAVAIRKAELQCEVEKKNALTKVEQLRAEKLSIATVNCEIQIKEAYFELYNKKRAADATFYNNRIEAKAKKVLADANVYSKKTAADVKLYAKQNEAEGIAVMAHAQGVYLRTLLEAVNGNYSAVRDYMMINNGVFQEMARINAEAIKGLQPKLSIWSGMNGANNNSGGALKDVAEVYSMIPPIIKTVNEQTGMSPPAWLGTLAAGSQ